MASPTRWSLWMRPQRPREGMCPARGHTARLATRSDPMCVQTPCVNRWAFRDPELRRGGGCLWVSTCGCPPRTLFKAHVSRCCLRAAGSKSRGRGPGLCALTSGSGISRAQRLLGAQKPCKSSFSSPEGASAPETQPHALRGAPNSGFYLAAHSATAAPGTSSRDTSRSCAGRTFVNMGGGEPLVPPAPPQHHT